MNVIKRRSLKQASNVEESTEIGAKKQRQPFRSRRQRKLKKEQLQSVQSPPCSKQHDLTSRGEKENEDGTHRVTHADREILLQLNPTTENARIDRVNAKIMFNAIACHIEDSELVKEYTGGQPLNTRELELETYSKLCNVSKRWKGGFYNKIRGRNLFMDEKEYETPLVSGKLTFARIHTKGAYTVFQAKYDLNLNPTRAINETNCFNQLTEAERKDRILGKTQVSCDHAPLRSLDNNNNLFSFEVLDSQYKRAENIYLPTLIDALQDELKRVCDLPSIELPSPKFESITFKEVETYWDIEVDDAPSLQERITPYLKSFGKSVQEREHGQDDRIDKNQKSLTIYINEQERIRIYAKAPNRIRFEIVSILKNGSSWLDGGRERGTKAGALRLIEQIKSKSVKRMNELIEYLQATTDKPAPRIIASDPDYVYAWARLFRNDPIAKQLLYLLITNGRLVTGQALDSISHSVEAILRRAKDHNLLARTGYCLHACLPCQKNFTQELTINQIKLINQTQNETQTVSEKKEFTVITRVVGQGKRIPPPPPISLKKPSRNTGLFCWFDENAVRVLY